MPISKLSFRFLGVLHLSLLLTTAATSAHGAPSPELRCRNAIEAGLAKWMVGTLKARLRCQSDILAGLESSGANCIRGAGSPTLTKALADARARLRGRLSSSCSAANWGLLSYPGPCPNVPGFGPDTLANCIESVGEQATSRLFDVWYPASLKPARSPASDCVNGVSKRAATMVLKEMRARLRCLRDEERSGSTLAHDCRAQLPPYGAGTMDATLDRAIARAQGVWLRSLPNACVVADFAGIGFGANCPFPLDSGAGIIEFRACVFRANRLQVPVILDLAFPSAAVCGNGILQEGEVCDDGAGNSDTKADACRLDCELPVCGDGTTDPGYGEECDDGGFDDLDGCNMSCGLEFCGDGIVNDLPNEVCDDGNTNPNDPCTDTCSEAACGDGIVCRDPSCTTGPGGGPEVCDQGAANAPGALCDVDCSGYARTCTLVIGVTNATTLGALTYEVKYKSAGDFLGTGGTVQCTSLVTGGLVSFFDNEVRRTVKQSLILDAGFQTPRDIARCNYVTNDLDLTPADFTFTVQAASTPALEETTAILAVTSVECAP